MATIKEVQQWIEEVKNAPAIPGRGGDIVGIHVADPLGCDADMDELEREGCPKVRLSFASEDATFNIGRRNLQGSGHLMTNRAMLLSIGKRALKALFLNSREGHIYLRLVDKIQIRSALGGVPPSPPPQQVPASST
jgi:hypothetical protein